MITQKSILYNFYAFDRVGCYHCHENCIQNYTISYNLRDPVSIKVAQTVVYPVFFTIISCHTFQKQEHEWENTILTTIPGLLRFGREILDLVNLN